MISYYNSTKVMVKSTVDCPLAEETGLNCPRSVMGTLFYQLSFHNKVSLCLETQFSLIASAKYVFCSNFSALL